ncbi:hypothetical protein EJ02DRAFT_38946 [Clathrospora elynae]|uniref:Extracellular membrane protein CFEM domain-containing protein n=1 Tax=Clathrospora elynae TaxID=706981 RepID=A0A6A5SEI4_9PLEO|nr:hypothetical protein EJ02DRAFT_38946 [Clathrospora elynae]
MLSNTLAIALILSSAASAIPALHERQQTEACQSAYNACLAAGTPQVACSCTLTTCAGEDNERLREYCSSATAGLSKPTSFSSIPGIPGGCNPAHPGSCPSSYFDTTMMPKVPEPTGGACPAVIVHTMTVTLPMVPVAAFSSIPGIPGGCNPAHPGSCPSSYFDTTTATPAAFTSIPGIPGGCNPAHPGSCPSSYFDTTSTVSSVPTPAPIVSGYSGSGY